eukprot:gene2732-3391_t
MLYHNNNKNNIYLIVILIQTIVTIINCEVDSTNQVWDSDVLGICPFRASVKTEGSATWYDSPNNGNCGYKHLMNDETGPKTEMIAALGSPVFGDTLECGQCYEISTKNSSIVVMVTDKCPDDGYCQQAFHFDLNKPAYSKLQDTHLGVLSGLRFRKVACPYVKGNIKLRIKEGSNNQWAAFLIFNHVIGVKSVSIKLHGSNSFIPLPRESYNYFTSSNDHSKGPFTIRVTSILGDNVETIIQQVKSDSILSFTSQFNSKGLDGCSPPNVGEEEITSGGSNDQSTTTTTTTTYTTSCTSTTSSPTTTPIDNNESSNNGEIIISTTPIKPTPRPTNKPNRDDSDDPENVYHTAPPQDSTTGISVLPSTTTGQNEDEPDLSIAISSIKINNIFNFLFISITLFLSKYALNGLVSSYNFCEGTEWSISSLITNPFQQISSSNADIGQETASTIKLWVLLSVLNDVNNGLYSLDDVIECSGQNITVDECCGLMIGISDNCATYDLTKLTSISSVNNLFQKIGMKNSAFHHWCFDTCPGYTSPCPSTNTDGSDASNTLTSNDVVLGLQKFYNLEILPAMYTTRAIAYLLTAHGWTPMIGYYLPVPVAHKQGWLPAADGYEPFTENDEAIIFSQCGPIASSVMITRNWTNQNEDTDSTALTLGAQIGLYTYCTFVPWYSNTNISCPDLFSKPPISTGCTSFQ